MPQLVRILPYQTLSGAENMAADEAMLRTAERGHASIRFYGWSEPTISLGYFQSIASRNAVPGLNELALVRRSTGGGALVHHHELTYALALPAGPEWLSPVRPWPCRVHELIQSALQSLAISSSLHSCEHQPSDHPFLCFQHLTSGDLTINGHKVLGSAQRRQHGAILQHGGLLLRQSPYTPQLPGILELALVEVTIESLIPAIMMKLIQSTGWTVTVGTWTDEEQPDYQAALAKYRSAEWNEKR